MVLSLLKPFHPQPFVPLRNEALKGEGNKKAFPLTQVYHSPSFPSYPIAGSIPGGMIFIKRCFFKILPKWR